MRAEEAVVTGRAVPHLALRGCLPRSSPGPARAEKLERAGIAPADVQVVLARGEPVAAAARLVRRRVQVSRGLDHPGRPPIRAELIVEDLARPDDLPPP